MPLTDLIKPRDINISKRFNYTLFGDSRIAQLAWYICKICQVRPNWEPFTYSDFLKVFDGSPTEVGTNALFDQMVELGFLTKSEHQVFEVTSRFVGALADYVNVS